MESAPLVSVVTPIHNTRNYLGECVESVVRQSYENWEYVLVDNCSTDGSGEIADQYASRFPGRIRVVHADTFRNQVQNYNFALTCISPESKYCKMVQADDWIFPECLKSMVEVAEAHPRVGIVAAYQLEGDTVRLDGLPYPSPALSGRHAGRLYFLKGIYLFGTPTSILMRSDLVRSRIPFYDERYAPFEDGHVCFDLLNGSDFGFIHQVLTYSRSDNKGITSPLRQFEVGLFNSLSMLVAHGRDYLSGEEYEKCLKQVERDYFLFLTKRACSRRGESREFWEFHRNGLAAINYSYDWKKRAKWLPRAILEKAWGAFWGRWDRIWRRERAERPVLQQHRAQRLTGPDQGIVTKESG